MALVRKLWDARKRLIVWGAIGALAGILIGFSIPKEYAVTVKLSPELSGNNQSAMNSLSSLASMAGLNFSSPSRDAMSPIYYPDIFESVPFATELFDVPVTTSKGDLQTTVYGYMAEHQRAPWWSHIIAAPFRLLGWCMSLFRSEEETGEHTVDPFRLTKEENAVVKALHQRILCDFDKKTAVITIQVTMQDPLIAATLTDTVMRNLQNHITDYRTNKARHDLEFTQKLHDEAQQDYFETQSRYARYMDANQNIVLRSARTEQERLQNEVNLKYGLYNQMAQQLQLAKAKVQESTPAYAVLQPATVPLRAAKPSKMMLMVGFAFLFGAAAAAWELFGKELVARFKNAGDAEAEQV